MKDALGHGSNPHNAGVNAIGPVWTKSATKNAEIARRIAEGEGHKVNLYRNPKNSAPAYYSQGAIHFNMSNRFWRDPVGTMQRATNLSAKVPEHVVHHEIGHALYDAPDNFHTLSHQSLAREHVSKYAAMNPKEFVSEIHAAMKTGKTFPEHVMSVFNLYARPRK